MRTSYSALDTYIHCPQKYKFQEIDKIRVPKSREALFGTLIHQTLNFMFRSSPLFPTLNEVLGYFREHWPNKETFAQESRQDSLRHPWSDEEEKAYFEEGLRMLKKFYENNAPWNFNVLDLESRFEINIEDPHTGQVHVLAGIIDRIDRTADGSYEIIDYKTSRRMPSQSSLDRNLQLSLYSLGLQKRWPHINPEKIIMSLYFLKHGEKLSTVSTNETTKSTKEHVLKTISEIEDRLRSGKDFEPMPGPLCDWCGFRPYCPAWRHLYRKKGIEKPDQALINQVLEEFLSIKKEKQEQDKKLKELQVQIENFMDDSKLTRLFGKDGYVSKKVQQKKEYDYELVKTILRPLGKWEEVLKVDDTKLKKIILGISEIEREKINITRKLLKEYSILITSFKIIKKPEDLDPPETLNETPEPD